MLDFGRTKAIIHIFYMLKHHSRFLKVELTDLLDVILVRLYKHIRLQLISALCAFSENRGYVQCVFSPSNLQLSTETYT